MDSYTYHMTKWDLQPIVGGSWARVHPNPLNYNKNYNPKIAQLKVLIFKCTAICLWVRSFFLVNVSQFEVFHTILFWGGDENDVIEKSISVMGLKKEFMQNENNNNTHFAKVPVL
jgi:hypothetical protein